jgi:hypothetical protein
MLLRVQLGAPVEINTQWMGKEQTEKSLLSVFGNQLYRDSSPPTGAQKDIREASFP